jgi:hypothetical protein
MQWNPSTKARSCSPSEQIPQLPQESVSVFTTALTEPHLKPDKCNPHPHTLCPKQDFGTEFMTIMCKGRKDPHGDASLP